MGVGDATESKQLKGFNEFMSEKIAGDEQLHSGNVPREDAQLLQGAHGGHWEEQRGVAGRVADKMKDVNGELQGMHRRIDEETPAGHVLKGELSTLRAAVSAGICKDRPRHQSSLAAVRRSRSCSSSVSPWCAH